MGLTKINNILTILYIMAALSGCRCKEEGIVPPVPKPLNCFDYWPIDSNRLWIYTVTKRVNTTNVTVYEDTMQFLKDTNILKTTVYNFKEFTFKKLPSDYNVIIGSLPNITETMHLYLSSILYTMFNLKNMKEKPPQIKYKSNGLPFDTRYEMEYTNIFSNQNIPLGKFKSIISQYNFFQPYNSTGGYISKKVSFIMAENTGLIEMNIEYQQYKVPLNPDSTCRMSYNIKTIVP